MDCQMTLSFDRGKVVQSPVSGAVSCQQPLDLFRESRVSGAEGLVTENVAAQFLRSGAMMFQCSMYCHSLHLLDYKDAA